MAKLAMQRLELLAPLEESQAIVDLLQRKGCLELVQYEDAQALNSFATAPMVSQFDKFLQTAAQTQQILKKYAPVKKGLLASFNAREELELPQYQALCAQADEILAECYDINTLEKQISDARVDLVRHQAVLDTLQPWLALDLPMQGLATATTTAFVGTVPGEQTAHTLEEALARISPQTQLFAVEIVAAAKEQSHVFVLCHKSQEQALYDALRELGFAAPADPTRHEPAVRNARTKAQMQRLEALIAQNTQKLQAYTDFHAKVEFVLDYFTIRREKYEALQSLATANSVFGLCGYIPQKQVEALTRELESAYTVAIAVHEPAEDEDIPVLLENNKFAAGVESITEMYSMPGKEDVDPNPVMSFFYYTFFGIMLSDAGYGLLMVIAMVFAKTKLKLEKRMERTVNMFLYCGLSTLFWGALFGGWFGDIIPLVAREFFGKEIGSLALWFEPVNDPMKMLLYSFLFGIIHLFVGLGVRFYMLWKDGKRWDAIWDVIPVYLLVAGVAPMGAGILISVPGWLSKAGTYMMLAGFVLVVLTSGRSSKNIIGKLGGGLYGLYNIASGYLGDVLSYSRLLALGLSTGVIASVVNLMGVMPGNKVLKAVLLVFVFIFGHAVNIAVNLIGTYVHTNRLQYVEFFSKFYEGGGRAFTPFTTKTKYYKFKEEASQ